MLRGRDLNPLGKKEQVAMTGNCNIVSYNNKLLKIYKRKYLKVCCLLLAACCLVTQSQPNYLIITTSSSHHFFFNFLMRLLRKGAKL